MSGYVDIPNWQRCEDCDARLGASFRRCPMCGGTSLVRNTDDERPSTTEQQLGAARLEAERKALEATHAVDAELQRWREWARFVFTHATAEQVGDMSDEYLRALVVERYDAEIAAAKGLR